MNKQYVHGYSTIENRRLEDQAMTLTDLLHHDSIFLPAGNVLEAGCGVGAQTVVIAAMNPECRFTSIDISTGSVAQAKRKVDSAGLHNVTLSVGDIFNLPYESESFDHLFVCFVLEHLPDPVKALAALKRVLKKGGTITMIEGDHGSTYFYPDSLYAQRAIRCQVTIQAENGGNAFVGRELYPLLDKAGFEQIQVSPRMVYVDDSKPELVDGFIKKTFTAMIEGVKDKAVSLGMMSTDDFERGIRDLYRTAQPDGVFCYTFFKAFAVK